MSVLHCVERRVMMGGAPSQALTCSTVAKMVSSLECIGVSRRWTAAAEPLQKSQALLPV